LKERREREKKKEEEGMRGRNRKYTGISFLF
jgi:hypothetical protein